MNVAKAGIHLILLLINTSHWCLQKS